MSFDLTWLDHLLAHSDETEQKEKVLKENCTKFKLKEVQSMVSIGAGRYGRFIISLKCDLKCICNKSFMWS